MDPAKLPRVRVEGHINPLDGHMYRHANPADLLAFVLAVLRSQQAEQPSVPISSQALAEMMASQAQINMMNHGSAEPCCDGRIACRSLEQAP